MVESLCAFDLIMITKVTISRLTINAGIVIVLTIAVIGEFNGRPWIDSFLKVVFPIDKKPCRAF